MNGAGLKKKRQARRAKLGAAALRSPLTALIVALSLFAQLTAVPYRQALAAPELSNADAAAIAADLKATFGDAAALCVQVDDTGAPAGHNPIGHCDDQCPLCRFAAQVGALVRPDAPAVPTRLNVNCRSIGAGPQPGALDPRPNSANRARAPPLAV